jgi:uncharacterized YigZ family protein
MESDSYHTIKSVSEGIYKEKGSRFLANAFPVSDIDEVKPIIEKIRKERHEARHHCFAYMIGKERTIWRVNDDGEPSGTAGRPILGQINSSGLTNILIVVSRYFGGTLLGVSGLINAYRSAAASAIENAETEECAVKNQYEITFPYSSMNDVMKILKEEDITQSDQVIDLECKITISFRASSEQGIRQRLDRVKGLEYFHSGNTN